MSNNRLLKYSNYLRERPKEQEEKQSTPLTIDPIIDTSGESIQYARLDHTHYLDVSSLNIPVLPSTYDFTDGVHSLTIQNASPIFSYVYDFNNDELNDFYNVFSFRHNITIYSASTHNYYYIDPTTLTFTLIPNFGPQYPDELYIPFYIDEVSENKIVLNKETGLRVFVEHGVEIGTISQTYALQLMIFDDFAMVINENSTMNIGGSNYNLWYVTGTYNTIGIASGGAININKTFWGFDLENNTVRFKHTGHADKIFTIDKNSLHAYLEGGTWNKTYVDGARLVYINNHQILYNGIHMYGENTSDVINLSNIPSVFNIYIKDYQETPVFKYEAWELPQNLNLQGIKPNTAYIIAAMPYKAQKSQEFTFYDITRATDYRWAINTSSTPVLKRYLSLNDTQPTSSPFTQGSPKTIELSDNFYINGSPLKSFNWVDTTTIDAFWNCYDDTMVNGGFFLIHTAFDADTGETIDVKSFAVNEGPFYRYYIEYLKVNNIIDNHPWISDDNQDKTSNYYSVYYIDGATTVTRHVRFINSITTPTRFFLTMNAL